jgi:chemotaxis protein MotB
MARKKKPEEHENLERWLVSYADFITLLFAVFVVLYALSQLDLAKFKDLKISLSQAFAPTIFKGQGAKPEAFEGPSGQDLLQKHYTGDQVNVIPPINPQLELKRMEDTKKAIEEKIQEGDLEGIDVKIDKRGLVISLLNSVFFDSGSAQIKEEAKSVLNNVALEIKKSFPGNRIRIEGHTDPDPISTAVFPSNWELSAARAASVVRYFIRQFKMDKEQFSAVGYADSIPIASNDTREGKQNNRRVEIVILNSKTSELEAGGSPITEALPAKAPEPEEKTKIEIIKGGRVGDSIDDLTKKVESDKKPEETHPTPQIFEPIDDLPVKKEKKSSIPEVLEVKKEEYQ